MSDDATREPESPDAEHPGDEDAQPLAAGVHFEISDEAGGA